MRSILLLASLALNVWLAVTVVRLENMHYGVLLGACSHQESLSVADPLQRSAYLTCLEQKQTRTGPWYHLAYALGIL
jgi:hypothetical protein